MMMRRLTNMLRAVTALLRPIVLLNPMVESGENFEQCNTGILPVHGKDCRGTRHQRKAVAE